MAQSHPLASTKPAAVWRIFASAESAVSVNPTSKSEPEYCPSSCSEASDPLPSQQREREGERVREKERGSVYIVHRS